MKAAFLYFILLFIADLLGRILGDFSVAIITVNNRHAVSLGSMPYSAGAMDLAVEQVRKTYGNIFNVSHTYITDDNAQTCDDLTAVTSYLLSRFYYNEHCKFNVTVVVFPGCSEQIEVINLTREWKILTVMGATTVGALSTVHDRSRYPHVISAGPGNAAPYAMLTIASYRSYGWKDAYVVYDSSPTRQWHRQIALGMAGLLKNYANVNVRVASILCTANQSFNSILDEFRTQARIFSFFGYPTCTRQLLIEASKKQMTNGEYVYITQDLQKNTSYYGTLEWRNNDENDLIAREAFQSLLTYAPVELVPVFGVAAFNEEVKRRALADHNFSYPPGEQVNAVATTLYNCVHMVAQVINASYQDYTQYGDQIVFDVGSLASRLLDRTFVLPMGAIHIDKGGERAEVPGFFAYDPNSTILSPVLIATIDQKGKLVEVRQPVWPKQWPVPNVPACGYEGNQGPCASQARLKTVTVAASTGAVCAVCIVAAAVALRVLRRQMLMRDRWWKLDESLVTLEDETSAQKTSMGSPATVVPIWTLYSKVFYQNRCVYLKTTPARSQNVVAKTLQLSAFLIKVRTLQHANLNPFFGILQAGTTVRFAEDYCARGDLGLFYKVGYKIDNLVFRKGLIADFLKGLKFIQESSVKYHGDLHPRCCLLDSRFTLKISGAGYDRLVEIISPGCAETDKSSLCAQPEWTAPEHRERRTKGTPQADVYTAGLILQQLIADFEQKFCSWPTKPDNEAELRAERFPEELKQIFQQCRSESPHRRPTATMLFRRYFRAAGAEKTSAVGYVLERLQRYADELEDSVVARTHQLLTEQAKCDSLLCEMLPRSIVIILRRGEQPAPESFDAVTISFTDIVGFADIAATALPEEVVVFLTKAHGLFDGVLSRHNVYKVESIGDSYLTASGLPVRNDYHAEETCRMAMKFHYTFSEVFQGLQVAARSGIHTGPCIAAVAGSKRPRYCLFGDTINTASRMESHGEGGKIQISMATHSCLHPGSGIKAVFRGMVHIKGKGEMATYWLESADPC